MGETSLSVLAANLAVLRQQEGMPSSQADIAKRAGVDQTTVSRTLRATNAISIDKLDGLAKAFNLRSWQLLVPGLDSTAQGLRPKALELAMLFESLTAAQQDLLLATARALHGPRVLGP